MATTSSSSTRSMLKKCVRTRVHHYLSEGLIFKILSWTPATSLLRFKSVSKLWRSIISDPNFIQTHHTNSLKTPSILLITSSASDEEEKQTRYSRQAATVVYSNSTLVNLKLVPPFCNLEFVSSCHGIICVCDARGHDIYLFNPFTRMYKKLPLFNDQPPADDDDFDVQPFRVDVEFGFDCVSHDFKVLRIIYDTIRDMVRPVTLRGVYLYSLKSDSWKEVAVRITLPSLVCDSFCPVLISGPVVDGVLYLEGMNEIVTFDLHDQVFGLIPFPSYLQRRKSNVLNFQGSVAVFAEECISDEDGSSNNIISLWTMEAISNDVFWNKAFTVDTGLDVDWVFAHLGANQFLGTNILGEVVYDFGKKETKYIGLPSLSFLVKVLKHSESFLSIEGFEKIKGD